MVVTLEGVRDNVAKLLFAPHIANLTFEWMQRLPGATLHSIGADTRLIANLDIGLVAAEVNARACAPEAFGGYFHVEAGYISWPNKRTSSLPPHLGCTASAALGRSPDEQKHDSDRLPCFVLLMRRETPVTFKSWAALCPSQRMACASDWSRQLAHLHARGLVHRDISVSNLATTPPPTGGAHGRLGGVLIDFGLTGPPTTTFSGDMVYAVDFRPRKPKLAAKSALWGAPVTCTRWAWRSYSWSWESAALRARTRTTACTACSRPPAPRATACPASWGCSLGCRRVKCVTALPA